MQGTTANLLWCWHEYEEFELDSLVQRVFRDKLLSDIMGSKTAGLHGFAANLLCCCYSREARRMQNLSDGVQYAARSACCVGNIEQHLTQLLADGIGLPETPIVIAVAMVIAGSTTRNSDLMQQTMSAAKLAGSCKRSGDYANNLATFKEAIGHSAWSLHCTSSAMWDPREYAQHP